MNGIINWLLENLHSSQNRIIKYRQNWFWYLLGLILLIIVV